MTKVKKPSVRVRIAPSPTGNLHIGTARTALFNWLFAKHHSDTFILRVEDTDKERSKPEYEKDIIAGLEWLGIKWDEFYKQSERGKIYKKYLQKLLDSGRAFWCLHTLEELEEERIDQETKKLPPRHVCEHKGKGADHGVIRLAVDENSTRKIVFDDIIRGPIEFAERLLGDIVIAKGLDTPLYNFAVTVDDVDTKISHVIRGEDHISNTPKQIIIYEALGVTPPRFAHLPLILGEDKSKLSKRHGATSLTEYRALGYLPEALVNFLALLGWTPNDTGREVLTKNEIIEQFSLEKIHHAGAVFDIKKLNWLNAQYIKTENDVGLTKLVVPFVEKHFGKQSLERIEAIAPLLRERLEYLDQVKEFHYFFQAPEYPSELLIWPRRSKTNEVGVPIPTPTPCRDVGAETSGKKSAKKALELITPSEINTENLDKIATEHFAGDRGAVYWPLRVALSGEKFSADPVQIARILTVDEISVRIAQAIRKLA